VEQQERGKASEAKKRLTRAERLRGRRRFQEIKKKGASRSGKYLTVLQLKNDCAFCRMGIIATRRVGGSVMRNRWRRIVKEIFRTQVKDKMRGVDLIFILRRACGEVPSRDVFAAAEKEIRTLLRFAHHAFLG
jgi:ribonuclease P protein component